MWATVEDVAKHLGVPEDERMGDCTDEALDWAAAKRPNLDRFQYQGDSMRRGVVTYAGLLYRERSSPQGIAGYEAQGGTIEDSTAYYRALDLIGYRRPVAR